MRSMMVPLVLLGGLSLCGSALAGTPAATEQATQQGVSAQGSAMKVAIDPVTGKRRPITEAESRALDVQADNNRRSALRSGKSKGGIRFSASQADAKANARTVNGITSFKPTLDMLNSVTATVDASGKVMISENGAPMNTAEELPSE